jgi:hypothetical protein
MTLRDQVWNATLLTLVEEGRFKISDLPFDENQRHTVRRVLREMEKLDWLQRDPPVHGRIWYAGPKAKKKLNLESRAEVLADPDFEL